MIPVLLRINSKTLSHKFHINTIDVLNKTSDGWKNLASDIPVNVKFMFVPCIDNLIWMECFISQLWVLLFRVKRFLANDIWDKVINQL